jgi:hypothetical protein
VPTPLRRALVAGALVLVAGAWGRDAIPADGPPQFLLAGVILVEGKVEKALLAEPTLTGGQPILVAKGERLGPYRLVKVLEDHVVLARAGQELTVRLGAPEGGLARREPAASAPRADPGVQRPRQRPSKSESSRAERRQQRQAERRAARDAAGSTGAAADGEPASTDPPR